MKKALSCILTIALLITVMAPCLFLQAQETGTGLYDKVLEEDGFIYGVNLPWISQGDDGSTWAANAITGAASSFAGRGPSTNSSRERSNSSARRRSRVRSGSVYPVSHS